MYNELYKAWKSEKSSQRPQPLPDDFYKRAAGYLKSLEEDTVSADSNTVQGRLLAKEKEMARRLLNELKETRFRKIIDTAKSGEPLIGAELTEEEKTLVNVVAESLTSFKEEKATKEPQTFTSDTETELDVVRFLQGIPEIVGVDLKIYGPYKKEDVGSLPKENAQALIKQGVAKLIEIRA